MRTMVHAVEAAIRMIDPHGQAVMIDLVPEGVESVGVEVTKMFPPSPDPSIIYFTVEVTVPQGQPCPDCGHVHNIGQAPHDQQQKPDEEHQA